MRKTQAKSPPSLLASSLSVEAELNHTNFWPGEKVSASVHLELPEDAPSISVQEITVQCVGAERLDPLWIRSGTGSFASPSSPKGDGILFKSPRAPVLGIHEFHPGTRRWFEVEIILPENTPPSHRGTAVRWSYQLTVTAVETRNQQAGPEVVLLRKPFRIWPVDGGIQQEVHQVHSEVPVRWREVIPSPQVRPGAPVLESAASWTLGIVTSVPSSQSIAKSLGGIPWNHVGSCQGQFSDRSSSLEMDPLELSLPPEVARLSTGTEGAGNGISSRVALDSFSSEKEASAASSSEEGGSAPAASQAPQLARQQSSGFAAGRTFNICMGEHPLVRLTPQGVSSGVHELGGQVMGTLVFPRGSLDAAAQGDEQQPSGTKGAAGGQWKCAQVLVTLETEEVVGHKLVAPSSNTNGGVIRKVHDEFNEVTADLLETHFLFSIPSEAEATFATAVVSLRWILRFNIVAVPLTPPPYSASPHHALDWIVPLTVRPSTAARMRMPNQANPLPALDPLPPPPPMPVES